MVLTDPLEERGRTGLPDGFEFPEMEARLHEMPQGIQASGRRRSDALGQQRPVGRFVKAVGEMLVADQALQRGGLGAGLSPADPPTEPVTIQVGIAGAGRRIRIVRAVEGGIEALAQGDRSEPVHALRQEGDESLDA